MNADQEIFYKCMMDRAKVDKQNELEALLITGIEAAEEFTAADFDEFEATLLSLVKSETVDQIKDNIQHFKNQSQST